MDSRDDNSQQQADDDLHQQWLSDPSQQAEYKLWLDGVEKLRRANVSPLAERISATNLKRN